MVSHCFYAFICTIYSVKLISRLSLLNVHCIEKRKKSVKLFKCDIHCTWDQINRRMRHLGVQFGAIDVLRNSQTDIANSLTCMEWANCDGRISKWFNLCISQLSTIKASNEREIHLSGFHWLTFYWNLPDYLMKLVTILIASIRSKHDCNVFSLQNCPYSERSIDMNTLLLHMSFESIMILQLKLPYR